MAFDMAFNMGFSIYEFLKKLPFYKKAPMGLKTFF